VDGRTDIHDDANSRFSNFADEPKNDGYMKPNNAIWQEPDAAGIPPVPCKGTAVQNLLRLLSGRNNDSVA